MDKGPVSHTGVSITVEAYGEHNHHDLNRCDASFTVTSKLVPHVADGVPDYTIVSVPPYVKHYPPPEEHTTFLAQRDKGIFFARVDGTLAGQIILFKNWNGYAYIDDLAVNPTFRRRGVGRALIDQAVSWAKARNLPGIMLETQNINVAACLFYARCGFVLGGYDRFLYQGLTPETEEIALYWYMLFPG